MEGNTLTIYKGIYKGNDGIDVWQIALYSEEVIKSGTRGKEKMQYTVKKQTNSEISYIYNTYMQEDFPAGELKPLSHIIKSMDEGYGFALGIYGDGPLVGYAVFVLCGEAGCALLDYFAIRRDRRGEGLGHRAFALFEAYFKEELPQIGGLYIESERIGAAENEKQRLTRERRIAFYQSCGCEMTNLRSILFGVDYSVLYRPLGENAKEASLAALDMIYRRMFKPEHYARFVSLFPMDRA